MLEISQATPELADQAANLIVTSGISSLKAMFEIEPDLKVEPFIRFAFAQQEGQFSFVHHVVAHWQGEFAGIASCWTDSVTEACREATIQTLVSHFGIARVPLIIERNLLLQSVIPPPSPEGLGVGHIAVRPEFQRKGVASGLLNHMNGMARTQGKRYLELDVECTNLSAIKLYQKCGFSITMTSKPGAKAKRAGFTAHHHMRRAIDA